MVQNHRDQSLPLVKCAYRCRCRACARAPITLSLCTPLLGFVACTLGFDRGKGCRTDRIAAAHARGKKRKHMATQLRPKEQGRRKKRKAKRERGGKGRTGLRKGNRKRKRNPPRDSDQNKTAIYTIDHLRSIKIPHLSIYIDRCLYRYAFL